MEFFGFNKWKYFFRTIRAHGGIIKSLLKIWRTDAFKTGCYMGIDSNGNKYYENKRYMIGRARWVEYADYYKFEYEGTQVTPEWFGWLHYMTDDVPCCNQVKTRISRCHLRQRWILPPEENLTGTEKAAFPYSTTRQFVQVWNGKAHPAIPCPIDLKCPC